MDLLIIIKETVNRFPVGYKNQGVDAVVLHIERAEKYWHLAKNNNDDVMFTDVIYRTNQAFEGALKEAYFILAGKDPSKTTPHKIEKFFETGEILKERVLASLTNYRKEWRNTSTHDYKLFFTEQESLLAIASVSTFCIILLEQMITKENENLEKERLKDLSNTVLKSIKRYDKLKPEEKIFSLLSKSYEFIKLPKNKTVKEYEYLGLLTGFLEAVDPAIKVQTEVSLSNKTPERADILLTYGNTKVIVELKRDSHYNNEAVGQILHYLNISNINNGVLMLFNEEAKKGSWRTQGTLLGDGPYITFVTPSRNPIKT